MFNNTLFKKGSGKGGFTLLEMIVSIAIFTVVATVAIGALLKVVDANKKGQTLKSTINNLNFAMDSMSREMRVGTNYYCTTTGYTSNANDTLPVPTSDPFASGNCLLPVSDWAIFFYSSKVDPGTPSCHLIFAYRFANNRIEKAEKTACNKTINANSFGPITSPDINFDTATLAVIAAPNRQSFAQLHLVGSAGAKERIKSTFDIQTSISQRLPD